jgi:hypothetical protein
VRVCRRSGAFGVEFLRLCTPKLAEACSREYYLVDQYLHQEKGCRPRQPANLGKVDPARGCGRIGNETGRARLSALPVQPMEGFSMSTNRKKLPLKTERKRRETPLQRERRFYAEHGWRFKNGPVAFTRPGSATPAAPPADPPPSSGPRTGR